MRSYATAAAISGIDALDIDSDDHVQLYQFKNPEALEKPTFESGDIDRVLAHLHAILNRKYESIANPELRGRIERDLPNRFLPVIRYTLLRAASPPYRPSRSRSSTGSLNR